MREPPEDLLRLTRFLGGEPSRDASRKQYWFLLVGGAAWIVWSAYLLVFWKEPADATRPFSEPLQIFLGLMFAAKGAAGLLWENRRGLSLWLSVIGALLFVPFVLLAGALVYAWVGVLGVGAWAVLITLVGVWDEARRRRRARG